MVISWSWAIFHHVFPIIFLSLKSGHSETLEGIPWMRCLLDEDFESLDVNLRVDSIFFSMWMSRCVTMIPYIIYNIYIWLLDTHSVIHQKSSQMRCFIFRKPEGFCGTKPWYPMMFADNFNRPTLSDQHPSIHPTIQPTLGFPKWLGDPWEHQMLFLRCPKEWCCFVCEFDKGMAHCLHGWQLRYIILYIYHICFINITRHCLNLYMLNMFNVHPYIV